MILTQSKRFYILVVSFLLGNILIAQTKKFQGQPPITIVSTQSKPVQEQWKGVFSFKEGDVYFSNNFDGGRLNGLIKNNDSTYTALITSENTPINMSPWYAFKIWSKRNQIINLVLTYQENAKHRYYPKQSNDGLHWQQIDSTQYIEYEKGDEDFGYNSLPVKIKMRLKVDQDTLWVASQELQTSKHVSDWSDGLVKEKFIDKKEIGRSRAGRPIEVITIGKKKVKRMVMVISRQHPPEVTGYLAMKSFVETITGNTKLAKRFRRKYTTHVVPLMNPDGVDNGHWRHNAGGIDLNRDWEQFNHPETRAVRDFMDRRKQETKGTFYFAIDFHSTWDDIYYTLGTELKGNMPGLVPDWLNAMKGEMKGYDPNIRPSSKIHPTAVSRNYFFAAHGAESLVFEIGDNTDREFIKEKGRIGAENLMRLMLERL